VGFAEAMATDGYARTPVAAVLRHAGVSRETYYRLFADKADGFLAALDLVSEVLIAELADSVDEPGSPIEQAISGLHRYLALMAEHRAEARLFLVETFAAGPVAIERRAQVQRRIAEELARVLGSSSDDGRRSCEIIVAAVGALIVGPVVADDPGAILALEPTISSELRRFHAAGLFD